MDDDQRYVLARHLDGVRVSELARSDAAAYAGLCGHVSQLRAQQCWTTSVRESVP